MTTLSANNLTLGDIIRRSNQNGVIQVIGETMDQFNGIQKDCPFTEGNLPGGHQSTYRSSLNTWSTINPNGTSTTSKSTTGQNMESVEYMQTIVEVHELVASYGGDPAAKLASESHAAMEGGAQTLSSRLISGNGATTAGQVTGLAARYNSLTTGNNIRNVIDGGALAGQTDCMSIYVVDWGLDKVHGFTPRGSAGGITVENLGKRVKDVSSTTQQLVYTVYYKIGFGLAVENWTSVVRIANIDKSLLIAGTGADLFDRLIQAKHKLSRGQNSKSRGIYANSTTLMMLDIQARNDVIAGGGLRFENVGGESTRMWQDIPVNVEDQLTESESVVS
jgi:hypothetical protein